MTSRVAGAPVITGRSDGIDFLRAIASVWVILAHVAPWGGLRDGHDIPILSTTMGALLRLFQPAAETHPAVVAFIVLSGYCVHRNGLRLDRFELAAYVRRRAWRILPVFGLGTAWGIIAWNVGQSIAPQFVSLVSGTSGIEAECLIPRATLLPAIAPLWSGGCLYLGNAPLLTVMTEIALYAAYPPILLWFDRSPRAVTRAAVGLVALGMLLTTFLYGITFYWWNNSSLFGFVVYWWIGAFGLVPKVRQVATARPTLLAAGAAMALLTVIEFALPVGLVAEARKVAFSLLVLAFVIAVDRPAFAVPRFVSATGRAGYSIYAFHAPILYLMLAIGAPWWGAFVIAVAAGYSLSVVIEQPLARLGRRTTVTSLAQ